MTSRPQPPIGGDPALYRPLPRCVQNCDFCGPHSASAVSRRAATGRPTSRRRLCPAPRGAGSAFPLPAPSRAKERQSDVEFLDLESGGSVGHQFGELGRHELCELVSDVVHLTASLGSSQASASATELAGTAHSPCERDPEPQPGTDLTGAPRYGGGQLPARYLFLGVP